MKNQETPKSSRAARLTHVEADTSGARRWCPSARGAARAGVLTPHPGSLLSPPLPPPGQRRAPGPKPGHSGSLSPGKHVCGSGGQTEPLSEGLRGAGARPAPLLWPSCVFCRLTFYSSRRPRMYSFPRRALPYFNKCCEGSFLSLYILFATSALNKQ